MAELHVLLCIHLLSLVFTCDYSEPLPPLTVSAASFNPPHPPTAYINSQPLTQEELVFSSSE